MNDNNSPEVLDFNVQPTEQLTNNQVQQPIESNQNKPPKKNKGIIIYIVIISIVAIGLVCFIFYDRKMLEEELSSSKKSSSSEEIDNSLIPLTTEEMEDILRFYNTQSRISFLATSYNKPSDANPDKIMWYIYGTTNISVDEANDFLKANNYEYKVLNLNDLPHQIRRLGKNEISKIFTDNLNRDRTADIKSWTYLEKYNAYYTMEDVKDEIKILECKNGKITVDGKYKTTCVLNHDNQVVETFLEKPTKKSNFIFVSNKCIENCSNFDK